MSGAPRSACSGMSIRTWQVFANISRSAEVPSFGERSAYQYDQLYEREGADRDHLRDRHAWPPPRLHLGPRRLPGRDQERAAVPVQRLRHLRRRQRRPDRASGHRGRLWCRHPEIDARARAVARPAVAQLAYTLNDFRFDGDAKFGDNVLPGAPRHFLRSRAALQASERHLLRPQHGMGAAGLLRRQRQHAEDRAPTPSGD